MRHTKPLIGLLLLVSLVFMFTGCFNFGDTGIVGTWTLVSITNGGPTQTASQLGISQTFVLEENGNFRRTTDGVITGEGTYTYTTSNGFLALTPTAAYADDISLGSGTSSVIGDEFDRGYYDSVTKSNVSEIYHRVK